MRVALCVGGADVQPRTPWPSTTRSSPWRCRPAWTSPTKASPPQVRPLQVKGPRAPHVPCLLLWRPSPSPQLGAPRAAPHLHRAVSPYEVCLEEYLPDSGTRTDTCNSTSTRPWRLEVTYVVSSTYGARDCCDLYNCSTGADAYKSCECQPATGVAQGPQARVQQT